MAECKFLWTSLGEETGGEREEHLYDEVTTPSPPLCIHFQTSPSSFHTPCELTPISTSTGNKWASNVMVDAWLRRVLPSAPSQSSRPSTSEQAFTILFHSTPRTPRTHLNAYEHRQCIPAERDYRGSGCNVFKRTSPDNG